MGKNGGYDERGLLGLAFHPKFTTNGRFYIYYSVANTEGTPLPYGQFRPDPCDEKTLHLQWENREILYDHVDALEEWELQPFRTPKKRRTILRLRRPFFNHNGVNNLIFSPETGRLILITGDGGAGFDPFHLSQNIEEIAGKLIEIDVDKSDLTDFTKAVTRFKELPPNILDVMYISVKGIRNSPGITFMKNNNKYWKFIGQVGQELVESIYRFQRYKPLHLANYKFHFKNTKSIADGTLNLGWRGWEGAFPTTVTSTCPNGTKRKTVAFYDDAVKTSEKRLVPLLSYFHEDKSSNKFAGTALTGIQAYLGNSLSPLSETIWFTDYARKDNESSYTEGVLAYVKINNGEKASPFSPVKIDHHFSNEHAFFVSLGANKEKSKLFLGAYHSASVTDYRRGSVYEIIPSHN